MQEAMHREKIEGYIVDHMEYARRLAKRFYVEHQPLPTDYDDIVAAAYLGLCDAAYRFDPSKGANFRTFSFLRIRGEMFDLLRRFIPTPRKRAEEKKTETEHDTASESICWNDELYADDQVHEALGVVVHGIPQLPDCELSYLDDQSPSYICEQRESDRQMQSMIRELSPIEQQVIFLKYYEELSFSQMSAVLNGAHKSGLSRVHRRAIRRMREFVDIENSFDE